MVNIVLFLCAVMTCYFGVLVPICSKMLAMQQKAYEDKLKVFKVLLLRRCYSEIRDIPISELYENIEKLEPLYNSIGSGGFRGSQYLH